MFRRPVVSIILSNSVRAMGLPLREESGREVCVETCSLRCEPDELATGDKLDWWLSYSSSSSEFTSVSSGIPIKTLSRSMDRSKDTMYFVSNCFFGRLLS